MKLRKTYSSSVSEFTLKIALAFLFLFLASAGFRDSRTSGWYQQYFPNLNGSSITGITFLDSLTGFAVTSTNSLVKGYIIKTTNGGDNWSIVYTYTPPSVNSRFTAIQFANSSTGYAGTDYFDFFKTTNSGLNWIQLSTPDGVEGMAVINKDTVLAVVSDGFAGGVYRTTNGGYNWHALGQVGGSGQPYSIYMYDKNLGFSNSGTYQRRTTNGGVNWTVLNGASYSSIQFIDSLTGWKCYDSIKKTTNGGLNWVTQRLPNFGTGFSNTSSISILNKDTIWITGLKKYSRPPVLLSTNGGTNWGYQIPDTNLTFYSFSNIKFTDNRNGWINPASPSSILHTRTGGSDTTYYTGIKLVEEFTPKEYSLGQNYPNPFNPSTNIPFELKNGGYVTLRVYDITGRMVKELMNGRWGRGSYVCDFDGSGLSSGMYIYQLTVDNRQLGIKKMALVK